MRVPPSCPLSGVVVIIAAHRARNAEETERNRPAPPVSPERCSQMHGCLPNSGSRRATGLGHHFELQDGAAEAHLAHNQAVAGSTPAPAPIRRRRSSGRVGLQNRPGGCEPLRTCQFSWRLGRSSDGAWLKTTRARRATASLHHSSWQEAGSPAAGLISRHFPCNSESCSQLFWSVA